jgi:hypothetical protein
MPSKFESAWLHTKALLYKFLGVISTILLLVIILRNPMLSDDHFEELKHILPFKGGLVFLCPKQVRKFPETHSTSTLHKRFVSVSPVC